MQVLPRRLRSALVVPLVVLVMGVATIILIGMLIKAEISHNHSEASANTEQRLLGAAQALSEHVGSTISAIDVASLYLRDVWQNNRTHFTVAAAEIGQATIPGLVLYVAVADRDGWIKYSSVPQDVGQTNVADRPYFKIHVGDGRDDIFIGKPATERLFKETVIEISRKLTDGNGRFNGIVIIAIRPQDLIRIYDNLELGDEGSVGLVGADAALRARQSHVVNETHELLGNVPSDRVYLRPDAPAQGVFNAVNGAVDQRPRVVAYRRMAAYPLVVYASETFFDITARTSPHDHELVLIGRLCEAGVLAFSLVVAWLFRRVFNEQANLAATNRIRLVAEQALRQLNLDLKQRVQTEVAQNREKDHLLIQQSRMAAMGEMVHNIAHQWRQPLNSLSLLISNLRDDAAEGTDDTAQLDADVAKARILIEKMSRTIDDFRDFFRPDREKSTFDLGKAVHDAIAIIDAALKNNHIELEIQMQDGLHALGYSNQFAQAVLNILVNAKEALVVRDDGDRRIVLRLARIDARAVLTIQDNAGGIDPGIMPKIFDPYFTTKEQGSGIGLYMVKVIIEQTMGGRVSVNNMGAGACFTLAVPLEEGSET